MKLSVSILFMLILGHVHGQCINGNCTRGIGEKRYSDGGRFIGSFENGLRVNGVYIYPNGELYQGAFSKNQRTGNGIYQFKNGDVFDGEYQNDEKFYGVLQFLNGDRYIGPWKNNQPFGIGTYQYSNGSKWQGYWENGIRQWGFFQANNITNSSSDELVIDSIVEEKLTVIPKKSGLMPRIFAVIVGIADYEGTSNDLTYADRDARDFYNQLFKSMPRETASGDVRLLVNREATEQNVMRALEAVFPKATENDFVLFFFSGHGSPGQFCPYNLYSGKLTHSSIKTYFRNSKAQFRLCIADACFSGSIGSQSAQTASTAALSMNDVKLAVIMSSRPNQTSIEDPNLHQGLFTYYLISGIRGKADLNKDSYVTAGELFLYSRSKVYERSGGKQVPVIMGQNLNSIPLSRLKN